MTVQKTAEVTPLAFRAAMARFPTGVVLLTHGPPATVEVMTANSFISVSLDPLLILVSVNATGRIRARLDEGGSFAVQVLGDDQSELAAMFARSDRPSNQAAAQRLGAVATAEGNVLIADALVCFECRPHARHTAGDHVLYIGEVGAMHVSPSTRAPLLFHRGLYGSAV